MRLLRFLIMACMASIFSGCEWIPFYNTDNTRVKEYIELLRTNQYDSLNLPDFSVNDIPTLLLYRNETQIITKFPRNPISSFYNDECKLGIYVMWTIESIRAVNIKSPRLIMRFPSQNPLLVKRNAEGLVPANEASSQKIAAKAYFDWWYFSRNLSVDPLGKTDYKWH
jgi:hypothetical protein